MKFFQRVSQDFFPPNMKYSHRNPVKKSWIDSLHSLTGGLNIRWLKVDCADHSACTVLTRVFIIWVIKIGRPNNDYWIPKNKIMIIRMMIIICGAHCLERICFNLQFPKIPGLLAHPHFLGAEFSKKRCAKFSWYRNPLNSIEIYHVESSFPHQNRWFLDARWSWVVLLPRRTWHCYHELGHTVGVVYIYIHVLYHNIYIYIA